MTSNGIYDDTIGNPMMRSEVEIVQELERVRALQAEHYNDILHGAAVALLWVGGLGAAPSEIELVLREAKQNKPNQRPPEKTGMIG